MTFAQPLMVPVESKTLKLPEAIDDSRLSDEASTWNKQPKELPSLLEYNIRTQELYQILAQVLDRRESNPSTQMDTISHVRAILDLDNKVMEWRESLPVYLKYESSVPQYDPLKNAPGSEPKPDAEFVLDFPALSKRLHCRYVVGSTAGMHHH